MATTLGRSLQQIFCRHIHSIGLLNNLHQFDAVVSSCLSAKGYKYINIGITKKTFLGNLDAKASKLPSGIKALSDYVHSKGLKLGIFSDATTFTCNQTMPGSLGHEEQYTKTFSSWAAKPIASLIWAVMYPTFSVFTLATGLIITAFFFIMTAIADLNDRWVSYARPGS